MPVIDRFLLILGGMLPLTLLMIVASRYVFEVPCPEQRTVLYWIPLLGMVCLSCVKKIQLYATQLNTRYYAEWTYDAATKHMIALVRAQHAAKRESKVRIGATWQLEPGINFYRVMYGLDWMEPVFRQSPDGDFDYYFLLFDDRALVERRGLKRLFADSLSGAVLAEAGGS